MTSKALITAIAFATIFASGGCRVQNVQHPTAEQKMNVLPVVPKAKSFALKNPEIFTLSNGLEIHYAYDAIVPLTTMRISILSASSLDPAEKRGLSALSTAMLKEGAAGQSASELSDRIERLGASVNTFSGQDTSGIILSALSENFEKTLEIASQMLKSPNLRQEDFNRLKSIARNILLQNNDDPDTVARNISTLVFFSENHPYAVPPEGNVETLADITTDDVKAFLDTHYSPSNAFVVAKGSIETEKFREMLEKTLGTWQNKVVPTDSVDYSLTAPTLKLTLVDKPDAAQSVIRITMPAPKAADPKARLFRFVNIPFGASFTSRLMQNIREDKGYSYGASAGLMTMRHAGYFVALSDVATEVTGEALKEFIHELKRLKSGDFTDEEVERAKAGWQADLVQKAEEQGSYVSLLAALRFIGESVDDFNAFARSLDKIDTARFNEIAREFPDISQASVVIVGDVGRILPQLKDLPLPEPVLRDASGKIIKQ